MKKLIISLFFIFSGLLADNHDVHCEGFITESDCSVHVECEWHTNEMACEDAVGHNDHADDDHSDDQLMTTLMMIMQMMTIAMTME